MLTLPHTLGAPRKRALALEEAAEPSHPPSPKRILTTLEASDEEGTLCYYPALYFVCPLASRLVLNALICVFSIPPLVNEVECIPENCWGILRSINPHYKTVFLTSKDEGAMAGYLLGRHSECDIRFDLKQISNRHCLIYRELRKKSLQRVEEECVYIEDLSSNGTFVNGKRLGRNKRHELHSGDEVQLAVYNKNKEKWFDDRFYIFQLPPRNTGAEDENLFAHNFELLDHLGDGNFASVKLAKHRKSGTLHAVKIIDKNRFVGKAKVSSALQQEIGILMGIHHVHGVFNEERYLYIILELAKGGELFDYIVGKRKLTEAETQHIFLQLFHAIKYLHDRSIAHRDLKPENVLFADKERLHVKISDFGLAKLVGEHSFMATLCGTPNYVAPEVLKPTSVRRYHKEVDMWSLGVILYICLCGFPPFNEEMAPPSLNVQIQTGKYDFPSPYWDCISFQAKDLVTRLLTVEPDKRLTIDEALAHPWLYMPLQDDIPYTLPFNPLPFDEYYEPGLHRSQTAAPSSDRLPASLSWEEDCRLLNRQLFGDDDNLWTTKCNESPRCTKSEKEPDSTATTSEN
ncbi:uncharacterized protein VTP21DRAFT_10971 [Calcarisporiella thermophila]|uniref:uncharacterized protein n=1 Tax=Calcarisporiella thermophila TaxID=911321 RepID=UPI0037435FAE